MATKSPQVVAEKWARNMASSGESMREGIAAVTENPAQKAKAQKQVMVQNWTQAVNDGKWERGLDRVTTESWKKDMTDKGIARATGNAQAAKPKMERFLAEALPYIEAARASLPPRGNFEANKQRMIMMAEKMHNFRRSS